MGVADGLGIGATVPVTCPLAVVSDSGDSLDEVVEGGNESERGGVAFVTDWLLGQWAGGGVVGMTVGVAIGV